MSITVKFNEPKEFCNELRKDAAQIDRKIVRVTNQFTLSSLSINIQHLVVIGSYTVSGQLVRLERYCGDIWNITRNPIKRYMTKLNSLKRKLKPPVRVSVSK